MNTFDFYQIPHTHFPFGSYNSRVNYSTQDYPYFRKVQGNPQSKSSQEMSQNRPSIIMKKYGDIDGDGIMDIVLLTGNKTLDSPLWRNITLVIQNGKTGHHQQITLKDNIGYTPTFSIGDFTGDKLDDILVVINTGGSSGGIYAYIFSNLHGHLKQISNSNEFNDGYKYQVAFKNQYQATVISNRLNEKYILDLTYKGNEYLSEIYKPNGALKEPIEGWVNPLSGLYPVDFNGDGTYEIMAYQRIAGRYNADSLGYVLTVLRWNGQAFIPNRQNVAIFGVGI